jgi:hypothetical protein
VGNVIILNAEDGADDTVVPRLMAAGADRKRVHIASAVSRTRYTKHPALSRPSLDRQHRALHRAGAGSVQGVLEGLTGPFNQFVIWPAPPYLQFGRERLIHIPTAREWLLSRVRQRNPRRHARSVS